MNEENVLCTPNEIPQMNLKDIMLGEISQSRKDKHCMTPLISGF
jgi:hypothetical protein